jgi:predicted TIM-barrel fold metal-dependent hydrolase
MCRDDVHAAETAPYMSEDSALAHERAFGHAQAQFPLNALKERPRIRSPFGRGVEAADAIRGNGWWQEARAYNDAVAQDLKECAHPEKYIGVGWVFLPDVEESCREIERAVKTLGLKAVKFMGGMQDANLGAERLWPLYDKISQLNIPILVHDTASDRDGHPNPALVGIEQLFLETDNNALAFLLAFPFRYMVDIGSLILRGALKEFPNLRICFVEGSAAFVPWLMERLDMDIKARDRLGKLPSEFFNQIWVSAFAAETSLRYACDFWRDHNLTVGSDYPHGDPSATWSVGTVKMVRELPGMSDADKEKILGANAMRLFGL